MRKVVWVVKNLDTGAELRFRTSKMAVDYINKQSPDELLGRFSLDAEPFVKKEHSNIDGYGEF